MYLDIGSLNNDFGLDLGVWLVHCGILQLGLFFCDEDI